MRADHAVCTAANSALVCQGDFTRAFGEATRVIAGVKFSGARDTRIIVDAYITRPNFRLDPAKHLGTITVRRFLAFRGLGVTFGLRGVPSALRPPFDVVDRLFAE